MERPARRVCCMLSHGSSYISTFAIVTSVLTTVMVADCRYYVTAYKAYRVLTNQGKPMQRCGQIRVRINYNHKTHDWQAAVSLGSAISPYYHQRTDTGSPDALLPRPLAVPVTSRCCGMGQVKARTSDGLPLSRKLSYKVLSPRS